MERLEAKKINGHTYYYYSHWAWVDGKCRRVWQKYLGKLENIVKAVESGSAPPLYAEVFQWGLPEALWKECSLADVVQHIDKLCPKRDQGLTTGQYIAIAAVNRAMSPASKRSMWDWFSRTILLRHIPHASKEALASQRFWDHMDRIEPDVSLSIWKDILTGVAAREGIDLSAVSYDGTNFYTFIDTFNTRCKIARHGKNKQGRNNLRQVSYALFCSADGHMPLLFDVYEGNRHDAKQFPIMLQRFRDFLGDLTKRDCSEAKTTLIFDKGNNSAENFAMLDSMGFDYVGSVKLDQHKDLASIPNSDAVFAPCEAPGLEATKAFRVERKAYGRQRVLVVTYNQNLFNAQWLTLQNDIAKAGEKLARLQDKLRDRAAGLVKGGKKPTRESIDRQCKKILSRQHMKRVIKVTLRDGRGETVELDYAIDADALHELSRTYLGKNILITSRADWSDTKIIEAYRSQFIIEDVFKEMKDRTTGSWWPLHHWTDSKIKVHGLYCTIGLLLRSLLLRRLRQAGLSVSTKRALSELGGIREVVNIYPPKGRQKVRRSQVVLTKRSEIQERLMSILGLESKENTVLG